MKKFLSPLLSLSFVLFLFGTTPDLQAQNDVEKYLGDWALNLEGGAGWLRVTQEQGYLDSELLWYGGSVLPTANTYVVDGDLVVTRVEKVTRGKDAKSRTQWVTNKLVLQSEEDGTLTGTAFFPNKSGVNGEWAEFTAMRSPAHTPAPDLSKVKYGDPIDLLANGTDGWSPMGTNPNGFSFKDGVLSNMPVQSEDGPHVYYANLRTDQEFEDFNLKLEVNVPKGNNSGVYLRGLYEIQVVDSYGKGVDSHNMGALYSRIFPLKAVEKPGGEWQSMDITLVDRHVTVILNGEKIIDNQQVEGVTGGAMHADETKPGPIYLQGDHGEVHYRNMVLTPVMN